MEGVFEYYNNSILCVNQEVFYEKLNLLTYDQFQKWCQRQKLLRVRTKGNGRSGLIDYTSIPDKFLQKIKKAFGDPYRKDDVQSFINQLQNDDAAARFLQKQQIDPKKEYQYYIEAQILNLYGEKLQEINYKKARNSGFKITKAKEELSILINELKTVRFDNGKHKFPHNLPTNHRALERRYKEYKEQDYENLIHGGSGNTNTKKIKGQVADWILAKYCLPNKPNTTEVHKDYMKVRQDKKWPTVSEDAIYKWLQKTEQRKTWVLARHGKATWINEFGHKVSRDKSDWFPYCYLAIDGTKLDWMHFDKDSSNKMGAKLYVNLVFDMYSEKIVGWDFLVGKHEDHKSHFRSFKMAIQETGCKPALITYDNQSGHKMESMQSLYSQLVTSNGGEHYPHRAKEHGSPVEHLIGRFQQQVLNQKWYSDKQGIRTKKEDSRPNPEFLQRFSHKLHKPEALKKEFAECVEHWNNLKHPKFEEARNEVVQHEQTYKLDTVSTLEMMHLFWVTTKKPATYRREGIILTIGKEKYHFEVYDGDGHVNLDFRDDYSGCKFFIQYDPDELDNYVRLYLHLPNGDIKYIEDAQPIKQIKTIPVLKDEHDIARTHKMLGVRDKEFERQQRKLEALRHRTNITEESLIEVQESKYKFADSLPKTERETAEAWLSKL